MGNLRLLKRLRRIFAPVPAFRDGHFYSPVVDVDEATHYGSRLWPPSPPEMAGIDLRKEDQKQLLHTLKPLAAQYDYPLQKPEGNAKSFFENNGHFEGLDARMLFCLLNSWKPRRMIEVGSGYSTLLAADVNTRMLDGSVHFTAVEPYPEAFLSGEVPGVSELIVDKVQDVPVEIFSKLNSGDLLFIDSSHVVKTASDVVHLYLEILPRLAKGVYIHIHDIFMPWDYPQEWVLQERRSWNELYLVRALLAEPSAYEIVFANYYASRVLDGDIRECFGKDISGGSLYLRKVC